MAWAGRGAGGEDAWVWVPTKRLLAHDHPLFDEGDQACGLLQKQPVVLDDDNDDKGDDMADDSNRVEKFPCPYLGCTKEFDRLHVFEAHYNGLHRHCCSQCRRTFPSALLLDIHILECHDAMFQILAQRQPMYRCLVADCAEKFQSSAARKDHLVRQHKYPANFRFHRPPKDGKKREGKGGKGGRGGGDENAMEVDVKEGETTPAPSDPPADPLTPSQPPQPGRRVFSYKVPDRITFGHPGEPGFMRGRRRGRGRGKGRHWHQAAAMETDTTVDIETVAMTDLSDALDDPGAGGDR